MRIGSYQFALSNSIHQNMKHFRKAMEEAAEQQVRLLIFPECALTGYPGKDVSHANRFDLQEIKDAFRELEEQSLRLNLFLLFGAVEREKSNLYNSAYMITPGERAISLYRKRALWGWDAESFCAGDCDCGEFEIDGMRVGVRICFEVRFPEYFRELYRHHCDCAVVLFADRSESDLPERYDLIRAHLRTRAVENVMPLVCANNSAYYQTAPTAAIDENGSIIRELPRHEEGLLVYDLEKLDQHSFGATGRRFVSDSIMHIKR